MKSIWAKIAHGIAVAGQLITHNAEFIPAKAQPFVHVGLAVGQMIIGLLQHKTNPDGTPAKQPYVAPLKVE